MLQFAEAGARTRGEPAHIVGELRQRCGKCPQRCGELQRWLLACKRRKLICCTNKWLLCGGGDLLDCACGKVWVAVQPSPYGGAAECERVQPSGARRSMRSRFAASAARMSAELLAEREWHRILQMRATDLDDVGPGGSLRRNG